MLILVALSTPSILENHYPTPTPPIMFDSCRLGLRLNGPSWPLKWAETAMGRVRMLLTLLHLQICVNIVSIYEDSWIR